MKRKQTDAKEEKEKKNSPKSVRTVTKKNSFRKTFPKNSQSKNGR